MSTASATTRTTCPYCGVGCGVIASPAGVGQLTAIRGDPAHPANYGALCVKGSALGETLAMRGRLLTPRLREAGSDRAIDWTTAIDTIAARFAAAIAEHGPDSVAMYVSGQLLTEDYYVANKFVKGYLGTANIDTNSRLCMASAVAGHKRAFGEDVVPVSYADVDVAELIVLVGSNAAWCHPVLHRRVVAARGRGARVVVIDPRRTASCDDADLHLPLRSGSDVLLWNGLLSYLAEHDGVDQDYVLAHTRGFDAALELARASSGSPAHVARGCGLTVDALQTFYGWFAATARVVTLFSQGVNQSTAGTDKVGAIIDCHLATGRIGRPGAGPFSITGQPNAMGGREVGGLANQLAAHLDLDNAGHRALVQGFWGSPTIAARQGLNAVELFEAVHDGRIKALWIQCTNPVVSLPDTRRVEAALARCPFVVLSEVVTDTATSRYAHLQLPALGWGEKDGTVTNSERCISRQRAFLPAPGEARADWWAVCEVAGRMGHRSAFGYRSPHEIFIEHARLSAHGQDHQPRVFDLGSLANLDAAGYDGLEPTYWPTTAQPNADAASRPFTTGRFSHADGRAKFVAAWPRAAQGRADDDYPLILNTGRLRDHWHTMSRTGLAPTLALHRAEPALELHPRDALGFGIADGALVRVRSRHGDVVLRAQASADVARGTAFAPIHWNATTASDASIGALVAPHVDPISGEPEFKHTPIAVTPFPVDWHGVLWLAPEAFERIGAALAADAVGACYWLRVTRADCVVLRLAGRGRPSIADGFDALGQRASEHHEPELLEYTDDSEACLRRALIAAGAPLLALYVASRRDALPDPEWLAEAFGAADSLANDRPGWLRGTPRAGVAANGAVVCACHGVREPSIRAAVGAGYASIAALGEQLRCGTNCGSCVPELRRLLAIVGAEDSTSPTAIEARLRA